MSEKRIKELGWVASSKKDLMEFPLDIQKEMGHALYIAQQGGKHKSDKPLNLAGRLFWRLCKVMATARIAPCTRYSLTRLCMCSMPFRKIQNRHQNVKQDMDLVEKRLIAAQQIHKEWLIRQNKGTKNG